MAGQISDINVNLNVIDNSMAGITSATKNINTYSNTISKATKGTTAMAVNNRTAMRSMRGQWGQLGQQVQDVAVQLQMGQNGLFVLAQQGSQIASLMGPGGAVLGAILAVSAAVVGALIPSFFKGGESAEEFAEKIAKLGKSLKDATPQEAKAIYEAQAQSLTGLGEEANKAAGELTKLIEKRDKLQKQLAEDPSLLMPDPESGISQADTFAESIDSLNDRIKDQTVAAISAREALDAHFKTINDNNEKANAFVKSLTDQAAQLGKTKTEILLMKLALEKDLTPAQKASAEAAIAQIAAYEEMQEALKASQKLQEEAQKKMEQYAEKWSTSVEDSFVDIISGTKSVKDAFKDMVKSIISDLIKMQMQRTMGGGLKNLFMNALGMGAPVSTGGVPTNANWVNPGTYYPPAQTSAYGNLGATPFAGGGFTGNGARAGGMDGQGGFPAILHPNETVIDHSKGQSGQQIVQNINVTTGVSQTVRAEIANMMPQIIRAAQSATADARMRGGSYSSAMGA